ncbi:alpha/beta fold hydrolase [Azospira restricta]|uniref:Alpha/beta hydrolase n=1 Tax=Azospira restricta TaxID=404405 RepID=A0A974PWW0_9RHOO|nr:alpha/beta hydrolase [Azospira restricta]QRJ62736.1 alpha/beta hydrolase [Azospira restricta]
MAPARRRLLLALLLAPFAAAAAVADGGNSRIGIVVMHGKGGSPTKFVAELAERLEQQGFLVANLEMPWSGRRNYDVTVDAAAAEVEAALSSLRAKGAQRVFVAGHSQGGLFALYFGVSHAVDGIIAIAPGGSVNSPVFRDKLGDSVELARRLLADGKGDEKVPFLDYEGSRGTSPVLTTPRIYLDWFDPAGAMDQLKAVRALNPATPVLFIVPTGDYPGLLRVKQQMVDALPRHPRTKLYEPDASHLGAPSASVREIADWLVGVANPR